MNDNPILDQPLKELGLSARIMRCFTIYNRQTIFPVKTIGDLTKMNKTDLHLVYGIGNKAITEIESKLADNGLTLRTVRRKHIVTKFDKVEI